MLIKLKADGIIYDEDVYINPDHIQSIKGVLDTDNDQFRMSSNVITMTSGESIEVDNELLNLILSVLEVRPDEYLTPIGTTLDVAHDERN